MEAIWLKAVCRELGFEFMKYSMVLHMASIMAFCQGAIRHCYLLGQFQMENISFWKQPFDERVQFTWLGKQWNSGLSSVFSTLVVGENAEMATVFLSYMFRSSLAFVAVASRISECHGSFRVLCVVLGCIWQRCRSKQQPCKSLGVCFNICDAKRVLRLMFRRTSYFFGPHRGIFFYWSPPLSFPYWTHL